MGDVIARVLDEACGLFYAHDAALEGPLTTLHVSPGTYEAILRARRHEVERGIPVLVLDLDLEVDPVLTGAEVRVSGKGRPAG